MEMIPLANPSDALKKISDELKEKFDEAGMSAVEEFIDKLDDIKDMVANGPANIVEELKGLFDQFKSKMQEFLDNPASLAPGSGCLSSCAGWYGGKVVSKLGAVNTEAQAILEVIKGLVEHIKEPMETLGNVLQSAMQQLEGTIKKLAKLPAEVAKLAGSISEPADLANIDTSSMKKALDVSGIAEPLDALGSLKEPLKAAMGAVQQGVAQLVKFLTTAGAKITACFDVPAPLGCLQDALMSQAPDAMTQLLDMVNGMSKLDLAPMQVSLGNVSTTICDLDPATVTEPVKKFAESSSGTVDGLDKLVAGAKMASGAGALGGALGGMFG